MEISEDNSVWKLINDLSNKKGITEIAINGPKKVFVERDGKFIQLAVELTKPDIYNFIKEVADINKKVINRDRPILDGNLPDGSRINAIVEPFVWGCPAISIRKYLRGIKSFETNEGAFGLYGRWIEFLRAMVIARMNVIVSGGTGAGKTTLMNMLLHEVPNQERVITIEDTLELQVAKPNVVRLEARKRDLASEVDVTVQDLVKNTLRMRPDRIIIGESRGGEFFDLMQAMNTGHEGSMTSIHANAPVDCLSRMENLFLMSGFELPYKVVRKQIASAVDFIIQIGRTREGQRVIKEIIEITGMEADQITVQTIAEWDDGELKVTGITPKNMHRMHEQGDIPLDLLS